jgi:hypothetical protein
MSIGRRYNLLQNLKRTGLVQRHIERDRLFETHAFRHG